MADSLKSRYIRFIPAAIVMLFIFIHSAMPADVSRVESGWIVDWVRMFLPFEVAPDTLTFILRKAAHFTEYLLLGLTLGWGMGFRKRTFLIGTVYAILDEIHQSFVPGRSCEIRDMCIDAAGMLVGMVLMKALTIVLTAGKSKGEAE